jgi:type VI secretion system secreted protein VgrG
MPPSNTIKTEQFIFLCMLSEAARFSVREFFGTEEIGRPASFSITLSSPSDDLDPAALVNTPGIFIMHRKGEYHPFTGMITEARYCSTNQFHSLYRVTLESDIRFLDYTRQSRVFLKKTIPEIIAEVLDDNGITDVEIACTANYPQKEYVVQFNESDLDFVHRIMEEAGIW